MRIENTAVGIRITGYNAVYPGTNIKYPHYNPDNFFISQDENGNLSCVNIDDGGERSICIITKINGYYTKQSFLGDFDWKLN